MAELRKMNSVYRNIIGNTKDTIDAIQKYIEKYNSSKNIINEQVEEQPAASIHKILKSTECKETNLVIQKIIDNM